jgi:mannose-6-phosphate isomerase-like protein (cupin superfamily)
MYIKQIENGLDLQDTAQNIAAVYDTTLAPGESIRSHYHTDFEEIYYILSGYGIMTIGEEMQEISRGDVVYIPANAPHTLLNTAAEVPLRFVTVTVGAAQVENEGLNNMGGTQ